MATASDTVFLPTGWVSVSLVIRRMVSTCTSTKTQSTTCGSNWSKLSRLQQQQQQQQKPNRLHKFKFTLCTHNAVGSDKRAEHVPTFIKNSLLYISLVVFIRVKEKYSDRKVAEQVDRRRQPA